MHRDVTAAIDGCLKNSINHMFISYHSQANDPLVQRDMKQKDELLTQLPVEGNTQGK
jgi:hypothetical protein